jgi:ADP-heptose:LPS heptosyltransferase
MPQSVITAKERSASSCLLERNTRSQAFFGEVGGHHRSVSHSTAPLPPRLDASAFPADTPLNAFFAWNEARYLRDRRYVIARDIHSLLQRFEGETEVCLAHLACQPFIRWRFGQRIGLPLTSLRAARELIEQCRHSPAMAAARRLVYSLIASIGADHPALHAAVFRGFEDLASHVDLDRLARLRPSRKVDPRPPQEILIIKLGALGDFIQALGPMPDIRRHHAGDRITLLTTPRYAELAAETRLFDDILIDRRPKALDLEGWVALRRTLRRGRFDRIYDLQTSDRSGIYAWLFRRPCRLPEWSGIVWRCSHPHANPQRDRQHTMDRQAEQLLMAGIYPVSLVPWLPAVGSLPAALADKRFVLLIPGSSPRHLAKRWPANRYGELAIRLRRAGYLPVLVGVPGEADLGRAVCAICPEAVDLVGRTDVAPLAALVGSAALTVGNDTGATHVAAAGANPVVVLFSHASDPGLCAPRGKLVHVLMEPDLADLSVERVFEACMAIAATPGQVI